MNLIKTKIITLDLIKYLFKKLARSTTILNFLNFLKFLQICLKVIKLHLNKIKILILKLIKIFMLLIKHLSLQRSKEEIQKILLMLFTKVKYFIQRIDQSQMMKKVKNLTHLMKVVMTLIQTKNKKNITKSINNFNFPINFQLLKIKILRLISILVVIHLKIKC